MIEKSFDRMISYLDGSFYIDAKLLQDILSSDGVEIDDLRSTFEDIMNQFFIPTATWGLKDYEEAYGLPVNEGIDISTRRNQVLAKRRHGRGNLVNSLQALEPSISLSWGRLILPFSIQSDADPYDYGPLIVLIEKRKPAHLGYSFKLNDDSGYTAYANHINRNKVNLSMISGSSMSGRFPIWSNSGSRTSTAGGIQASSITGDGLFNLTAQLYSGPVIASSNVGMVFINKPAIEESVTIGMADFVPSGTEQSGLFPTVSNDGSLLSTSVAVNSQMITGNGYEFPCGVKFCGEEVA